LQQGLCECRQAGVGFRIVQAKMRQDPDAPHSCCLLRAPPAASVPSHYEQADEITPVQGQSPVQGNRLPDPDLVQYSTMARR